MPGTESFSLFQVAVQKPDQPNDEGGWLFVVLPAEASATLPRRGRTSIQGDVNGVAFSATLEPDGQRSHWLKLDQHLIEQAALQPGKPASFKIRAMAEEPEPEVPADFYQALQAHPQAWDVWQSATTLARVDWVHWVESAKQAKTRQKRIHDACDMLAAGKRRVCCFDPSGFYSKALHAPKPAQQPVKT